MRRHLLSSPLLNPNHCFIYLILLFEMGSLELPVALVPALLLQFLGLILQVMGIQSRLRASYALHYLVDYRLL